MEKTNIFFLIIIAAYLIYSFIKSRKKEEKEMTIGEEEKTDYYKYVIAASISSVMEDRKYRIKKIFLIGEKDVKDSLWKNSGRQESMMRRTFYRKK